MGRDIHVRLIKKDRETGKWNQIKIYRKEKKRKFSVVDIYPFRNYELFGILDEKEDEKYYVDTICVPDLPIALKQEIEKFKNIGDCFDFREINLADLKLYLYRSPKIRDWDYEDTDPKAWKDNPVKYFIERIEQYLAFADPYWDVCTPASDIRIIYWFD